MLFSIALFFISPVDIVAQSPGVKPTSDYLQDLIIRHRIIVRSIESNDSLSIDEKLEMYDSEIEKLKARYRTSRMAEYESVTIEKSLPHSCTNGVSGQTKDCGCVHIYAPSSDMYTNANMLRVVGSHNNFYPASDGSSASICMTKSGRGRNAGTLFANFQYRPNSISTLIENEVIELFRQLLN